jgi:hypothetical protein
MRVAMGIALVGPALCLVASFALPRARSEILSPLGITLAAVAGALWIGFSANSDARRRLRQVKRGFAAHGELQRLLREYLVVYCLVLLRLQLMAGAGLVVARWGGGPWLSLWLHLAAVAMILLSWPTRRKIELLVARAKASA